MSKKQTPLECALRVFGTQEGLATSIGIARTTVASWNTRRGGRIPEPYWDEIQKLAKELGKKITTEELRHGKNRTTR